MIVIHIFIGRFMFAYNLLLKNLKDSISEMKFIVIQAIQSDSSSHYE